ncbi:MAG TPA: histidine kinase, partial [Candidatus Binatia bacterium]|nr:histidine kinase [Candidatus Binatia bacterium]
MPGRGREEDDGVKELRGRLRVAGLLSLAATLLFVPLELHSRTAAELPRLAIVWSLHLALSALALALAWAPLSLPARALDRLIVALVLFYVANGQGYLAAARGSGGLVAIGLSILLILSAVFFGWSAARTFVVSGVTCAAFATVGTLVATGAAEAEPPTLLLGGLLVGAAVAVMSARALARFRASLAAREAELAALSARLMAMHEEERRRISRELHEGVGQSLTAVNAVLWLLEREHAAGGIELHERAAEARRLLAKSVRAIRELSALLRPAVLDDFGLVPSLDAHLKAFAERHAIATKLEVEDVPERLPADVETALYRIVQEGLSNVARHAGAR